MSDDLPPCQMLIYEYASEFGCRLLIHTVGVCLYSFHLTYSVQAQFSEKQQTIRFTWRCALLQRFRRQRAWWRELLCSAAWGLSGISAARESTTWGLGEELLLSKWKPFFSLACLRVCSFPPNLLLWLFHRGCKSIILDLRYLYCDL